jgi:hypothetical protein
MEVSGQLHAPAASPPGKVPLVPLDRRLGGHHSRSGHGVEERNSQPPPGIETRSSDRPARSQSLYRLSYPGYILHFVDIKMQPELLLHKTYILLRKAYIIVLCPMPFENIIFIKHNSLRYESYLKVL